MKSLSLPNSLILLALLTLSTNVNSQCNSPSDKVNISGNDVSFTVLNGGDLGWDLNPQGIKYEVPKGSGVHALFTNAIWFGGIQQSEARVAGTIYRVDGTDFYPGPLDNYGNLYDPDCSNWNRVFVVEQKEIDLFLNGLPASQAIKDWPGKSSHSAPDLAPFHDVNRDGIYNYEDGDYPKIMGDICFWYVMNDVGGPHLETGGTHMGIEIQVMGYVYDAPGTPLHTTTFFEHKVTNKSNHDITDSYISFFLDGELGNGNDDFIASHSKKNLGIFYNANSVDKWYSNLTGYGKNPPALGLKFLSTPIDDSKQQIGMSNFMALFTSGLAPINRPSNDREFYNNMRSIWNDGTPLSFGGNGYDTSSAVHYPYMFDIVGPSKWTECSAQSTPQDRKFIMGSGPFLLKSGNSAKINSALIWARDTNRTMNCDSLETILGAADFVQDFFDANHSFPSSINANQENSPASIYPNPSNGVIIIKRALSTEGKIEFYDLRGHLQKTIITNQNLTKVQDLKPGTYFVRISEGEQSEIKKVSIVR